MGDMAAIGERSLAWFGAERVEAEAWHPDVTEMVRDYSGLLYRVALSVVRNAAVAEDVVQDTFVRVLQQKGKLGAVVELRPWLVRICWNLALDWRRRVRPAQMDELFAAGLVAKGLAADEAIDEAQRIGAVLRAMERLPEKERHVLLLSANDELGTGEIAEVLGKSESSVRALLFRARSRLRERLKKDSGQWPQAGGQKGWQR
jgi:RNA polymerase sigma-70 factor, ECF subfamily